jgi:hypothetical protein
MIMMKRSRRFGDSFGAAVVLDRPDWPAHEGGSQRNANARWRPDSAALAPARVFRVLLLLMAVIENGGRPM